MAYGVTLMTVVQVLEFFQTTLGPRGAVAAEGMLGRRGRGVLGDFVHGEVGRGASGRSGGASEARRKCCLP